MGITVATTRVALNTSTGTQNITTTDLGGLTPKAAIFLLSYAITDGTAASDSALSIGAATGATNRWVTHFNSEDAQSSQDCIDEISTSAVLLLNGVGGLTAIVQADFSAWITNGVTINIGTSDSTAYLLTVILFAGTDLSAHANTIDLGDSTDNAVDITAPGFEPDLVFASAVNNAGAGANNTRYSYGVAHNDGAGGVTQRAINHAMRNGDGDGDPGFWLRNDCIVLGTNQDNAADWEGELGSFDSSGFTCTTRTRGANGSDLNYLALSMGGAVSSWVGTYTTPTATGDDSDTGPGFTPQILMFGLSLAEAVNTSYTDSRAGSVGIASIDADDEYSIVSTNESGVATTNTQSLTDDRAIVVPADDGSLDIEATFSSFDANGWTVNYSNAPATAKLFWALAIEEEAGAGPSSTGIMTTNTSYWGP